MAHGKHYTTKKPTDPTYSAQWSGVSYAPHCTSECKCPDCNELLHLEDGSHYCPRCDDFKPAERGCEHK